MVYYFARRKRKRGEIRGDSGTGKKGQADMKVHYPDTLHLEREPGSVTESGLIFVITHRNFGE